MRARRKTVKSRQPVRALVKGLVALAVYPLMRFPGFLWRKKLLQRSLYIALVVVCVDVASYFFRPDISRLRTENPRLTELMVYMERHGKKSWSRVNLQQTWLPLSRISPYLVKAVLIAEDDKFWYHGGFDIDAIRVAIERDIKARKFKFGGSTITQQLAKNLYLSPSKNPVRKLKEAIITWRIERALPKKRILEIYLNVVEWGDSIYGIEAAARHYYDKHAWRISPYEAARLATVLPNPKKYKPLGNSMYVDSRAAMIYEIMLTRGIVERDNSLED